MSRLTRATQQLNLLGWHVSQQLLGRVATADPTLLRTSVHPCMQGERASACATSIDARGRPRAMLLHHLPARDACAVPAHPARPRPAPVCRNLQAARLYEVASEKLVPPLPTRPGAAHRQRALQSDGDGLEQQLDEATLARLAETIGSSKTLSKKQLDEMASKIKYSGLKHKINPDHPEKNLKKVIDQLTQGERDLLKSRLHDL